MEGIEIKKRGRPKGSTKEKAAKKKIIKKKFKASEESKKAKPKKSKKTSEELIDDIVKNQDSIEKDLELLSSDELDDEAKRAMIRARNSQAKKQERLNAVAESSLVEKEHAMRVISGICQRFVERLNNTPDKLTPQLHKRSKSEIREKMVKEFDFLKADFIQFINEGL